MFASVRAWTVASVDLEYLIDPIVEPYLPEISRTRMSSVIASACCNDRKLRGLGKPETFAFLGFTFIKADGKQRPLAIAALEDKIVQGATVMVLNAIYEGDFVGLAAATSSFNGRPDATACGGSLGRRSYCAGCISRFPMPSGCCQVRMPSRLAMPQRA
jgi:hypothetical protein